MAYDNPFQLLPPEAVHFLSAEYNYELRSLYIDCLALFQGLLGQFSSGPVVSIFNNPQEVDHLIEVYISRMPSLLAAPRTSDSTGSVPRAASEEDSRLKQLQRKADLLRDYMVDTVRANKQTAIDLHAECLSPQKALSHEAAFGAVDDFLNILITQYRSLRFPYTQPRVMQATQ